MNWNWPGAISTTPPNCVQLVNGSDRFVVTRTPSNAPGLLVKLNWKAPFTCCAPVNVVAVGMETLMLTTLLVLWIPLTNTVASAWPGGKFQTGKEVN